MNLRKEFERMLAEALQETLASRGFRPDGLGFRREQQGFVEHYSFQPSQGNLNQIKCRYYLNVGLEFPILSPAGIWAYRRGSGIRSWRRDKYVDLVYIRNEIVWAARADGLVRGLPLHWEIRPGSDLITVKHDILHAIDACSAQLAPWARSLRAQVWKAWLLGWLALPFIRHKLTGDKKRRKGKL